MTALYLIAAEYKADAAKLTDLDLPAEVIEDTLESLAGELEAKAQSVAFVIRSLESEAAAIAGWRKAAEQREKAALARAERLRDYLAGNLIACGIERVSGPGVEISFRKSSAVVIDEPGLIPVAYMRQPDPPPPAPDKKAIAEAIKAGADVPGAHVEHRKNLQIK